MVLQFVVNIQSPTSLCKYTGNEVFGKSDHNIELVEKEPKYCFGFQKFPESYIVTTIRVFN